MGAPFVFLRVGDLAQTSEMLTAPLTAITARLDVVGHLLVVGEAGEARALDAGYVDEHVLCRPFQGR